MCLAFTSNPFTQCQRLFIMVGSCVPRFWCYFVIFVYSASPCSTSGSACTARSGSFYHFSWHRYLNLLYQNNILVQHNCVVAELIQIYTHTHIVGHLIQTPEYHEDLFVLTGVIIRVTRFTYVVNTFYCQII